MKEEEEASFRSNRRRTCSMDWISGATESVRGNDGGVLVRSTPQCLRTDIPCFSALCPSCRNGQPFVVVICLPSSAVIIADTRASLLPGDVSHYAIPTPKALDDYSDIFCSSDVHGVIVTQVRRRLILPSRSPPFTLNTDRTVSASQRYR